MNGLVALILQRKINIKLDHYPGAPTDRAMYFYIGGLVLSIPGVARFFWKRK